MLQGYVPVGLTRVPVCVSLPLFATVAVSVADDTGVHPAHVVDGFGLFTTQVSDVLPSVVEDDTGEGV